MDLYASLIRKENQRYIITLYHKFNQNDDLLYDPLMKIKVDNKNKIIEALTYQDIFINQSVYFMRNGKEFQDYELKISLNQFLATWLRALIREEYKTIV